MQGGISNGALAPDLMSLGRIDHQIFWLFYPAGETLTDLAQLRGKRIGLGAEGSGDRAVCEKILAVAGITYDNTTLVTVAPENVVNNLDGGAIDAVFRNFSPESPVLDALLRGPQYRLMLACLKRAREAGNTFFPEQSRIWVFPAETGHVAEVKEDGKVKLSHTGHALRHSFRTLAGAAGIDRLRLKILMNHALERDVTDSYANVPALFDSLMDAQRQISAFIVNGLNTTKSKPQGLRHDVVLT